jgi:hypothetical protein
MKQLGKTKSLRLLQEFEQEGLAPLESLINNPNYPEEKKKDIRDRIELYQKVINNFQVQTISHIHFVMSILAIRKFLLQKELINEDNEIQEKDIANSDLEYLYELLFSLFSYYEIKDNKIIPSNNNNNDIVSLINNLNNNNINVTIV